MTAAVRTRSFEDLCTPTDGRPTLIASGSDEADVRLPPFDLDMHLARWWMPVESAGEAGGGAP